MYILGNCYLPNQIFLVKSEIVTQIVYLHIFSVVKKKEINFFQSNFFIYI